MFSSILWIENNKSMIKSGAIKQGLDIRLRYSVNMKIRLSIWTDAHHLLLRI